MITIHAHMFLWANESELGIFQWHVWVRGTQTADLNYLNQNRHYTWNQWPVLALLAGKLYHPQVMLEISFQSVWKKTCFHLDEIVIIGWTRGCDLKTSATFIKMEILSFQWNCMAWLGIGATQNKICTTSLQPVLIKSWILWTKNCNIYKKSNIFNNFLINSVVFFWQWVPIHSDNGMILLQLQTIT